MNDKPISKSQAKRVAVLKSNAGIEPLCPTYYVRHPDDTYTEANPQPQQQPQYREPTLEDAWQLKSIQAFSALEMQYSLKQLGFVRKVQP